MLPVHTSSNQCTPSKPGAVARSITSESGSIEVSGACGDARCRGGAWQGAAAAPAWGHPWVLMGVGGLLQCQISRCLPQIAIPSPRLELHPKFQFSLPNHGCTPKISAWAPGFIPKSLPQVALVAPNCSCAPKLRLQP